tara:strand:- start:633 stop:1547 length:915 start_codon:yes stop_codon:yes gene_type:complete
MSTKVKVILLSANAFSGSTIFSLFLGRHPEIVNLGEVINLENDYNPNLVCTCGSKLLECSYWQTIKDKLDQDALKGSINFNLNATTKRSLIDRKGILLKKILIILGFSPKTIYGKKEINNYLNKNTNFFKKIDNHFEHSKYIVDASKPPERIDILLSSPDIDIYCIHLNRNLKSIFNSNLKRSKKTRNKFGFKFYRELLLLYMREKHRRRIFNKIHDANKITIDFENFMNNPDLEYSKVLNFLFKDTLNKNNFDRNLLIKNQHIYVGNRWIFEKKSDNIYLNKSTIEAQQKSKFKNKLIEFFLG